MSSISQAVTRHYFLTEETLKEIHTDDQKLKTLFTILSKERELHFIPQSPQICCDLVELIPPQMEKGNLSKELVKKVITAFTKHSVFSKGKVLEDVEILCKEEKKVEINSALLRLTSDYFDKMFSNGMKESQNKTLNYSEEYGQETIQLLKTYIYEGIGAFTQTLLNQSDLASLGEIYALTDYVGLKEVLDDPIRQALQKHINTITSPEELKSFIHIVGDNPDMEKEALLAYLKNANIEHNVLERTLSIEHLGLLGGKDTLGTLLRKYTKGFSIDSSTQMEELELLEFMPEESKKSMEIIAFPNFQPSFEMLQTAGRLFPKCKQLIFSDHLLEGLDPSRRMKSDKGPMIIYPFTHISQLVEKVQSCFTEAPTITLKTDCKVRWEGYPIEESKPVKTVWFSSDTKIYAYEESDTIDLTPLSSHSYLQNYSVQKESKSSTVWQGATNHIKIVEKTPSGLSPSSDAKLVLVLHNSEKLVLEVLT